MTYKLTKKLETWPTLKGCLRVSDKPLAMQPKERARPKPKSTEEG